MNIPYDIFDYAQGLNLDAVSTGGGFDFVWKQFPSGRQAIVAAVADSGSPASLSDEALIIIYEDEEWQEWFSITFRTTSSALMALAFMTDATRPDNLH